MSTIPHIPFTATANARRTIISDWPSTPIPVEVTTAEHVEDTVRAAEEEDVDPRGENACPECEEGELEAVAFSRLSVTERVCNVCGYPS